MIDFSEPVKPNCSDECECGRPKRPATRTCNRCAFLDGVKATAALVIDAIRGHGAMSIRELCTEVYGKFTHDSHVSMIHTLRRLERRGRIRKYWREGDIARMPGIVFGRQRTRVFVNSCWAYALDEKGMP